MILRRGRGLIDVGTDHGIIPIQLAREGYPGNLFASDLREGPLGRARSTAQEAGVEEKIRFLLCDGLELCPPEAVDTVLIAGMGGDTICGILDRAEWIMNGEHRLILQPMTHPEVLRYWLLHNEFCIDREEIVPEDGHLYQCFSAVIGTGRVLSDAEYLIGDLRLPRAEGTLDRLIREQRDRLNKKLGGFQTAGREQDPEACFYRQIRDELTALLDRRIP